MQLADFDATCAALPGAALVVQWGDAHVYKVGGKVFAIGGLSADGGALSVSFKASPIAFEVLLETGQGRRAPYLPHGNWVAVNAGDLGEGELADYLRQAYAIIRASLPKAAQRTLDDGSP